jgi:CRP-like cAMP-binding protein
VITQPFFAFLSEADHRALFAKAQRIRYPPGAVVLEEGSPRRSLCVIRHGFVCVQRHYNGRGITLAQLGPGSFFGEVSFLEQAGASASIVALQAVEIDEIAEEHVHALLASVPGFAARFYQSLATALAHRLRLLSQRLTSLNVSEVAQVNRFHTARTGNIGACQVPEALAEELRAARQALDEVEGGLRSNRLSAQDAQAHVAQACDRIMLALAQLTQDESLLEIGWADLLSFRDIEQLEMGLGAYVFREAFPIYMSSATMARCYMKPRGYPDDFEMIQMIWDNAPEGDGALGRFVDAWFLGRPVCRARRNVRRRVGQMLQEAGPAPVTSLACGAAAELAVLQAGVSAQPYVTCLDIDTTVLEHLATCAEQAGLQHVRHFAQGNVISIAAGHTPFSLAPQRLIYALDLCDYLDDAQIVMLLNWTYEQLAPGGSVVLSNLAPSHPDAALMTHILEWGVVTRSQEHLRSLFTQSRFAPDEHTVEIITPEPGSLLLARAVRS